MHSKWLTLWFFSYSYSWYTGATVVQICFPLLTKALSVRFSVSRKNHPSYWKGGCVIVVLHSASTWVQRRKWKRLWKWIINWGKCVSLLQQWQQWYLYVLRRLNLTLLAKVKADTRPLVTEGASWGWWWWSWGVMLMPSMHRELFVMLMALSIIEALDQSHPNPRSPLIPYRQQWPIFISWPRV